MNVDSVIINNKSYLEIDKINVQDVTYVYLVNKEDSDDFCIRKLVSEGDKFYYEGLKDNDEFDLALMYFTRKHENIIREVKDEANN